MVLVSADFALHVQDPQRRGLFGLEEIPQEFRLAVSFVARYQGQNQVFFVGGDCLSDHWQKLVIFLVEVNQRRDLPLHENEVALLPRQNFIRIFVLLDERNLLGNRPRGIDIDHLLVIGPVDPKRGRDLLLDVLWKSLVVFETEYP